MKATELRINNLVMKLSLDREDEQIYGINPHDFSEWDYWIYEPIPITPEWLERAGFECSGFTWDRGIMSVSELEIGWEVQFQDVMDGWHELNQDPPCQYIHQLQNLYFALTGKELVFK